MTNDQLREAFKLRYPDIAVILQVDINELIWLIDRELSYHAKNGGLEMHMLPMDRFTAKMIREKGLQYKGLELKVRAHYFERGREAITFGKDGNVYFCGWAGGNNHEPFLKAFKIWIGVIR